MIDGGKLSAVGGMPVETLSAGGVVISPSGKILVVSQRGTSWSLPKGHLERGETTLAAATREIEEESGVTDLEFVKELGSYQRFRIGIEGGDDTSELKTITMFLFRAMSDYLRPSDPNNPEALWVDRDQVCERLTHARDKEFFSRALDEL